MNYQNYDDYMRNTLGFSGMNQSMGMPYGGCANMGCTGMCQIHIQTWQILCGKISPAT